VSNFKAEALYIVISSSTPKKYEHNTRVCNMFLLQEEQELNATTQASKGTNLRV